MADTLEIFGTEYTDVTGIIAINNQDTELTYVRPQGTKSITANGTGIDVTTYANVDVNVPSSGEEVPVFTIDLSNSPPTATCNKTFAECVAYINNYNYVAVANAPLASITFSSAVYMYISNYSIYYAIYNNQGYPFADIVYMGNGDITYSEDSPLMQNLPTEPVSNNNGTLVATIDRSTSTRYLNIRQGYYANDAYYTISAVPNGTEGTPAATKGTVSNYAVSVTPSVINTMGFIDGGTHTGTAVTVSASELVNGTYTISASGTHDVTNYASASVASGSATASATKGTVSNNSITVTPSVTKTAGYIAAGSENGTAVTVSASELVSGSQTIMSNGTVDVTNLASVTVAIPLVTYYTGTSDPSSSIGSNGDIYLKVVS